MSARSFPIVPKALWIGLACWLPLIWLPTVPAQERPPVLMAEDQGRSTALTLAKADIEVRILGFIAETRMTLVFRNDLDRPLAGDLYFPLPPGATVSG